MPYIKKERRKELLKNPTEVKTPGELNFLFHELVDHYFVNIQDVSYSAMNGIIGALECCKLEIYRRLIAPYENDKCRTNGDIDFYESVPLE